MTRKRIYLIVAATLSLLVSCQKSETDINKWMDGDFYIEVDLPEAELSGPDTRVTYYHDPYFNEDDDYGNIAARWELGDIIKVYETSGGDAAYTDVYAEYENYAEKFPYPRAPVTDKYYRFECVGGAGTSHGIFRYVGLTTATVVAGLDHPDSYNVNLDIVYKHQIRNWDKFDGLVIYGNPLRNYMMRHQSADGNLDHLKYGERMKGHLCSYNFGQWYDGAEKESAGVENLLLYNTESCVFRVIMGGFEDNIYGGATLSIDMPGVTSGFREDDKNYIRNNPMSLTLGNRLDHQENQDPWCVANPGNVNPNTTENTITAYVVGWDGTLKAGKTVTVTLKDNFYGKAYTWTLSKSTDVSFKEGYYYTFDLRDDNNKRTVTTF